MIRVVCFDLGGVVIRICRGWDEAAERAGLSRPEPADADFLAARAASHHLLERGDLTPAQSFSRTSAASGGRWTPSEVERVHHAWIAEERAGITAFVRELNRRDDLRTACLSNTNAPHWERLLHGPDYPTPRLLRHHLLSFELGRCKPEHEIYERAQQSLDAAPQEILFFDDLRANVEAAKRCGWQAIHVEPTTDVVTVMRRALREIEQKR